MKFYSNNSLISQAAYAKELYSLLPKSAFSPNPKKALFLLLNVLVLIQGWAIINHLEKIPLIWLYLLLLIPLMGNSVAVLISGSHDLLHGSIVRNVYCIRVLGLLSFSLGWMPPTLWRVVHNRIHHGKTNSLNDPDRSYLHQQPNTWCKRTQNFLVPSSEVSFIGFFLGLVTAWGVYTFRNLTYVVFLNGQTVDYLPATFKVSNKERWMIIQEFCLIAIIHLSIFIYFDFNLLKLTLGYFMPLGIGYAIWIFYIYTNHLLCPITEINDPLVNSLSIKVPKILDLMHFNSSYHTEHHLFPGMNSEYYPLVRDLLKTHFPERFNCLEFTEAWRLLLQTPRYYKDETTLTDWLGETSVSCPCQPDENTFA